MEDKFGLDRTAIAYSDVGLQGDSSHYLIVNEGMGEKAVFAVDSVEVTEFEVSAYKNDYRNEFGVYIPVIRFNSIMPWRLISRRVAYPIVTRDLEIREIEAAKENRIFNKKYAKDMKSFEDSLGSEDKPVGQYV